MGDYQVDRPVPLDEDRRRFALALATDRMTKPSDDGYPRALTADEAVAEATVLEAYLRTSG